VQLVFAHGWALECALWDAVIADLGAVAGDAIVLDAGYYGQAAAPSPIQGARILGVGQSLGALELLTGPPALLCGLVAIDGFARFARAPDFTAGLDPRALRLMARRLDTDPCALLDEFLHRASSGATPPHGAPDVAALARGLDRLTTLDGRGAAQGLPVWRLHAADDPIAPLALSDASFAGASARDRRVRAGRDHLSPLTAPQACAALIRDAIQTLTP
jgi:pimeloyl-[acyl-carrier protein] methyl ester esterase